MLGFIAVRIPSSWMESLFRHMIGGHANSLPPDQGLKFLFNLEDIIYRLENWRSIDYDKGVHTKHRHTKYHDFFVKGVTETDLVLDIGCGKGEVAFDVANKTGAYVIGIDNNEDHFQWANEHKAHDRLEYILGQAPEDLPSKKFSVVLLSNILEHISDRTIFLQGIIRDIQPERLLIRVPLFERDWRVPLRKELNLEWRLDLTHETEYTLESFAEEMFAAGLNVTNQEVRWGEIWAEARPVSKSYDI